MTTLKIKYENDHCVATLGDFAAPVPKWLGEAIDNLKRRNVQIEEILETIEKELRDRGVK